jgi:transmembrane sensor
MKSASIPPNLLEKYLNGTCTAHEKALVEAWYEALEKEQRAPESVTHHEREELLREAFERISAHIDQEATQEVRRPFPWRLALGLAASLLFLFGVYSLRPHLEAVRPKSAVVAHSQSPASLPVTFINLEARLVQHSLPDGSTVWLHPQARITYPAQFDSQSRKVAFEGEGFFDIQKDRSRPFFIHSGEMTVRVLGTSFNVRATSEKKLFEISVVTGSVEVTAPDRESKPQQVILQPQQQALFETDTRRLFAKSTQAVIKREIYQPTSFHFQETPVSEVISQLESQFAIHITLSNPGLANCRLNADFEQQPFPAIIEMLCRSLEATYTLDNTTVTIAGEPCKY